MPKHWLRQYSVSPNDETFWHATTFANVVKLFNSPEGIQPKYGSGQNGNGLYVCPRISDYQKVMALRNRKDEDKTTLFLLKILAKDFYSMKAYAVPGFAGHTDSNAEGQPVDVIASMWDQTTVGVVTDKKKPDGSAAYYDRLGQTEFTTLGFGAHDLKLKWKEKPKALQTLWELAQKNAKGETGCEVLDKYIAAHGARRAWLDMVEELAFKQAVAEKLFVVDAMKFMANSLLFETNSHCGLDFVEYLITGKDPSMSEADYEYIRSITGKDGAPLFPEAGRAKAAAN